jgi:hypothetical protein
MLTYNIETFLSFKNENKIKFIKSIIKIMKHSETYFIEIIKENEELNKNFIRLLSNIIIYIREEYNKEEKTNQINNQNNQIESEKYMSQLREDYSENIYILIKMNIKYFEEMKEMIFKEEYEQYISNDIFDVSKSLNSTILDLIVSNFSLLLSFYENILIFNIDDNNIEKNIILIGKKKKILKKKKKKVKKKK